MSDNDQLAEAFAKVMMTVRKMTNMSASEFAAAIGWDERDYIDREKAKWGPSLSTLLDFSAKTKIPAEALLAATRALLSQGNIESRWDLRQYHLYRLGWICEGGGAHELDATFESVDEACHEAEWFNNARAASGEPLLTRISAYMLMGRMYLGLAHAPTGGEASTIDVPSVSRGN